MKYVNYIFFEQLKNIVQNYNINLKWDLCHNVHLARVFKSNQAATCNIAFAKVKFM